MSTVPGKGSPRRIVFDGQDLRVVVQPAASPAVVACFNWGKFQAEGDHFYADELMRNLGLSAVGIVSKRPHWYVCEEWPQAQAAILEAMAGHTLRVGYGFSMGAYAALKYSSALGLDKVLAFSPQWSVDPQEAPWDDRRNWAYVPAMKGMGVRAADRRGLAYLFVDDEHPTDRLHLEQILQSGDNVLVSMRHCKHDTIKMLIGRESMGQVLKACMGDDPAEVLRVVKRRKRHSPRYRAHLCAIRAQRRLEAGDSQAAVRGCLQALRLCADAAPVLNLKQRLIAQKLLPDNSVPQNAAGKTP